MPIYEKIKGKRFSMFLRNGSYFQLDCRNPKNIPPEQFEFLIPVMRIHRHALSGLRLTFVVPDRKYYGINFSDVYLENIQKDGIMYTNDRVYRVISETLHVSTTPNLSEWGTDKSMINPSVKPFATFTR